MKYVTVNPDNSVSEMIDGDRDARPPGGVAITETEARLVAEHPIGHSAFDLVNGALQENITRKAAYDLKQLRRAVITEIRAERNNRITAAVPALEDAQQISFLKLIWPMLDTTSAPPAMVTARMIYEHAETRIATARTATEAQLLAYNPGTDPGWP